MLSTCVRGPLRWPARGAVSIPWPATRAARSTGDPSAVDSMRCASRNTLAADQFDAAALSCASRYRSCAAITARHRAAELISGASPSVRRPTTSRCLACGDSAAHPSQRFWNQKGGRHEPPTSRTAGAKRWPLELPFCPAGPDPNRSDQFRRLQFKAQAAYLIRASASGADHREMLLE